MFDSALGAGAKVVGFRGTEALSTPYRFDVYLSLGAEEASDEDIADMIGTRAMLSLDRQDGRPPYVVQGVVTELDILHEQGGRLLLGCALVPMFATLANSLHSRMFTSQSLPEIIGQVLEDAGLTSDEYALRLVGDYATEEHVCQYRESDLAFLSRWMEREGLTYYFEHGDRHEVLVITDDTTSAAPLVDQPVRFFALGGHDASAGEALHSFVCRHKQVPARVRVSDYNYAKPNLDVSGETRVAKIGAGELRYFGERTFSPDDSERLAKLRTEALLAKQRVFHASGTAMHLRSGYAFKLEDHPRESFAQDYLVTSLDHRGVQRATTPELRAIIGIDTDRPYEVELSAIAKATPFRPERQTPWPRVYGVEHAVIDGEEDSDYAQLDGDGRYQARFGFDESDLPAAKASTRIRMMQPHGGDVEGWHFPLRKGTEVLVSFLGGDPDRPVIAGTVPNTLTPSPVTQSNHTMNYIRTGGRNEVAIQDEEGKEHVRISTPRDATCLHLGNIPENPEVPIAPEMTQSPTGLGAWLYTEGSGAMVFGKDLWRSNGGNYTEFVKGAVSRVNVGQVTEELQTGRETTITGHEKLTVTAGLEQDITGGAMYTITGGVSCGIDGPETHVVKGPFSSETDATSLKTKARIDHVTGPSIQNYDAAVVQNYGVVTQNFGPTVATYGSLIWNIPGGATINTPSWNHTTPSWYTSGVSAGSFTAISIAMAGVGISVGHMSLTHTTFAVSSGALTLANSPIKLSKIDAELRTHGIKATLSGLTSFS